MRAVMTISLVCWKMSVKTSPIRLGIAPGTSTVGVESKGRNAGRKKDMGGIMISGCCARASSSSRPHDVVGTLAGAEAFEDEDMALAIGDK